MDETIKVEGVHMLDRFNTKKPYIGTLYLTATHLFFIDSKRKKEVWILLTHIGSVSKLPIAIPGSPLHIRCKNFRSVTFVIPRERDSHEVFTSLQMLTQPGSIEQLYCFRYTASTENNLQKHTGWNKFDLQAEYARMGVPCDLWIATAINKDYEICDTYPKYLFVPATVSTPILVGSSRFRSRGRFPVLSYLHKNNAAICRCSQPLSGFSARCVEDEQLLNCILRASPNSTFMYVVDTRPKINAMANKAAGKGYENASFYENIKFQFFGIENIHVMRNSLQKLLETCELKVSSMSAFLSGLESCGWLRHVRVILETAQFIAKALERGVSVLVHCSDGWDRTAQTCSLASLLVDPYYRTIIGFQALIEKEWLAFGHKFTDRCDHIPGDPKEVAPVFTQFIDAVWQLSQQFPCAFQFNENFLLTVHDHVYSCQFGTFIGNCEKDRVDLRLSERTYSLWGYLGNHLSELLNPLYRRDSEEILCPNLMPQAFQFWRGMYNRFENGVHPRESLIGILVATKDHISSMEDHILLLQRRIDQLRTSLGHADTPSKDIDCSLTDSGLADELACKLKLENACSSGGDVADSGYSNGNFPDGLSPSDDSPKHILSKSAMTQLVDEIETVALEWKSSRNVKECVCSTPLDEPGSGKFHCWSCGDVFCIRCIDKRISLPGHYHKRPIPVCRHCYKVIMRTNSVDS